MSAEDEDEEGGMFLAFEQLAGHLFPLFAHCHCFYTDHSSDRQKLCYELLICSSGRLLCSLFLCRGHQTERDRRI